MAPVEVSYWRKRSATKNPQKLIGVLEFTDDKVHHASAAPKQQARALFCVLLSRAIPACS